MFISFSVRAEMHLLRESQNKKGTDNEMNSLLYMDLNHTSRGVFIFIPTFQNTATKMSVAIL